MLATMGHGASVRPSVTAQGGGRYVVANVDFSMPGQWQLRLTFSGPIDLATPHLKVEL